MSRETFVLPKSEGRRVLPGGGGALPALAVHGVEEGGVPEAQVVPMGQGWGSEVVPPPPNFVPPTPASHRLGGDSVSPAHVVQLG